MELDLSTVVPAVSGPKRPQDRIDVPHLGTKFEELFTGAVADGGFGRDASARDAAAELNLTTRAGYSPVGAGLLNIGGTTAVVETETIDEQVTLKHGSILIAAITSCTNTSNPSVMLAAGLVAKKANALGLKVPPYVKTSLGPGSRVVTDYLLSLIHI